MRCDPARPPWCTARTSGSCASGSPRWASPVPRWAPVSSAEDVEKFLAGTADGRAVLKTVRGGYDGRGVTVVTGPADAAHWLDRHPDGPGLLVEELVPFTRELSVLVARSPSGQAVAYPVVQSVQRDGICREVYAPAPGLLPDHALAAQEAALRVAGDLEVTGLMAVELFDTPGGVLVNELALRPHNTGHWTIEGAVTSQFEQHLRAVLDLPLGSPAALAPHAVMVNVLGGTLPDLYPAYLHCMAHDPGLKIHVYGKQVRPGRKVGHVTVTGSRPRGPPGACAARRRLPDRRHRVSETSRWSAWSWGRTRTGPCSRPRRPRWTSSTSRTRSTWSPPTACRTRCSTTEPGPPTAACAC